MESIDTNSIRALNDDELLTVTGAGSIGDAVRGIGEAIGRAAAVAAAVQTADTMSDIMKKNGLICTRSLARRAWITLTMAGCQKVAGLSALATWECVPSPARYVPGGQVCLPPLGTE